MLKPAILDGLSKQINQELTASYGYLRLSVYFELQVLKGFASYFRKQADEEHGHAMRLLEYVLDTGADVKFSPVNPPNVQLKNVLDACKFAQSSERNNTASINALYNQAVAEGDLATQNQLQWFINEQVEEEKWADEFVQLAEKFHDHPGALFMWDHRVGKQKDKEDDEE